MSIAIIGALGQLGRDLTPRLNGDVRALTRADIDLEIPEAIQSTLEMIRPTLVINCAAYNFVDKAESDPDSAFRVNVWGVRSLAKCCARLGIKLVQVSSDYVFGLDSTRNQPWSESESPGPVSVYGTSKLAGEYFTLAANPQNLVVRTCGLYGVWGNGGKGGNFVETMLRLAQQGKPLKVVADQVCTPTYTVDLAEMLKGLIRADATGLFHATNSDSCSWFDLAQSIFRLAGMNPELSPITSAEFGAAAKRPSYSVLSTNKLQSLGLSRPRSWRDALAAYLEERKSRTGTS